MNIERANEILINKRLDDIICVIDIEDEILTIRDVEYGDYQVQQKNLAMCMNFPIHKKRQHADKLKRLKEKYLDSLLNEVKVVNIFYGPDHGYKNRSFYFKYIGKCGHTCVNTYAVLKRHIKTFECKHCKENGKSFKHGERKRINGVVGKRSSTYTSWLSIKSKLSEKYQDFTYFKDEIGIKPPNSKISEIDGKPLWKSKSGFYTVDREINIIAGAIRQSFRQSKNYKLCQQRARVETNEGVRYQCAICKNLFKLKETQVDHIIPIQHLDGSPLTRDGLIERIWDSPIQVLDRECHVRKTSEEIAIRKKVKAKYL